MILSAYAAYYDNKVREASSSGGVFTLLSEQFDVVYGVAMTEDCYAATFVRSERADVSSMRGSKYLQARLNDTFRNVKNDLASKKTVLFTGTPCQINGLKLFLGKEFSNLYCIDVICHGVPSPALFKKYITHIENRYNKKVKHIDFRCKDHAWKHLGVKRNAIFTPADDDPYMQMFLRDYCLRPSCYACKAKNNKLSDMTIADFWGIEQVAPELNDGKGTSLIIIRTPMGKDIFEKIRGKLKFLKVPYEDAIKNNPAEYSSAKRPAQRETFFTDMAEMDFGQLYARYVPPSHPSLKKRIKLKVRRILSPLLEKSPRLRYGTKAVFTTKPQREGADGN